MSQTRDINDNYKPITAEVHRHDLDPGPFRCHFNLGGDTTEEDENSLPDLADSDTTRYDTASSSLDDVSSLLRTNSGLLSNSKNTNISSPLSDNATRKPHAPTLMLIDDNSKSYENPDSTNISTIPFNTNCITHTATTTSTTPNNHNYNNIKPKNCNSSSNNNNSHRSSNTSNTVLDAPSSMVTSVSVKDMFDWYLDSSDEEDDWRVTLNANLAVQPKGSLPHNLLEASFASLRRQSSHEDKSDRSPSTTNNKPSRPRRESSTTTSTASSLNQKLSSDEDDDVSSHYEPSTNTRHFHKNRHQRLPYQQHNRYNSIYSHTSSHFSYSSHTNINNKGTDAQYMAGISARPRRESLYAPTGRFHPGTQDVIKVFKEAAFWGANDDPSFLSPTEAKARLVSMTGSTCSDDDISSPVKYFTHELSLRSRVRQLLVRHSNIRLASTFFDFLLKVSICIVYIVRVYLDDIKEYECHGSPCVKGNGSNTRDDLFKESEINWYVLLWIQRSYPIWITEVILCSVSLLRACFIIYIFTKSHRWDQVLTSGFLLELCCALPMLITNNLHLNAQRFQNISVSLAQQMALLMVSVVCLVFTNVCFIQHIQRASKDTPLSMIDSFYFVIVTFSTVGYGDISPDIWLSRLFMVLMICVAFATIPRQIEGIISTWMERKRAGGEYSQRSARVNKHVVVCSSSLPQDTVMDFLHEFYAHPKLEEHTVILLCPEELDGSKQVILKDPKWMHRVIYMMGSSLKDVDLQRCRVQQAEACFLLAPRPTVDKTKADRHTILRSWAVKDFAPQCRQYIQLFRAVNKIHVKFADHIVCEDEFKYALLANNCLYPGLSTLVSLLVHTSSGREGLLAEESWQQVYGRHSGNEIYHIQLQKSIFFSQYEGESFARASADAHHRFGVALLAVLDSESLSPRLQLNPGPQYKLKAADFCFYMSVTKEEYSKISPEALKSMPKRQTDNLAQIALALQKYQNESETPGGDDGDDCVFDTITSLMGDAITKAAHGANHNNSTDNLASAGDGGSGNTSRLTVDKIFPGSPPLSPQSTSDNNNKDEAPVSSTAMRDENKKEQIGEGSQEGRETPVAVKEEEKEREINANVITESPEKEKKDEEKRKDTDKTDEGKKFKTKKKGGNKKEEGLDNVDHRHGAGRVLQFYNDMGQEKLTTGPPPVTIYSGAQRTNCHIMTEPRQHCCLEWGPDCDHCNYKNAKDERWHHQIIILAAQHPSSGIFNFIVPLRSSFLGVNGLSAIVLLLEEEPDSLFVDTMAQFPLVYWMMGSISRVDDLLLAGINKASHLVVVNRASDRQVGGEDILADSETIVAVQTIFKLFPNTNVITELSQASNMRFMQFNAQNSQYHKISHLEQKIRNNPNSNLNYIFRLPFAAGHVFSASMLDTLLYQTFVKGYLISFVRLLLGIDAEEGSGHLSSIRVKRATIEKFPEYGQLYEGLCSATGEIPFAIYRTEKSGDEADENRNKQKVKCDPDTRRPLIKSYSTLSTRLSAIKRRDISDMSGLIRNRLRSLDLSQHDYSATRKRPNALSYVITNPSPKRKLRVGDIVYVLQPSSMYAKPSKHKLYMGHRAHSYSGPSSMDPSLNVRSADSVLGPLGEDVHLHQVDPTSEADSPNVKETKVGRFNLRRFISERPADDVVEDCGSLTVPAFDLGAGDGEEMDSRL